MVSRVTPVAALVTEMAAPGMTPPLESKTVPRIAPRSVCAHAEVAKHTHNSAIRVFTQVDRTEIGLIALSLDDANFQVFRTAGSSVTRGLVSRQIIHNPLCIVDSLTG